MTPDTKRLADVEQELERLEMARARDLKRLAAREDASYGRHGSAERRQNLEARERRREAAERHAEHERRLQETAPQREKLRRQLAEASDRQRAEVERHTAARDALNEEWQRINQRINELETFPTPEPEVTQ